MRILLASLVVLVLVVAATPALSKEEGHGHDGTETHGPGGKGPHSHANATATANPMGKGGQGKDHRMLFGAPHMEGDRFNGTFAGFTFNATTGELADYWVGNVTPVHLMDSVRPATFDAAQPKLSATTLRVHSRTFHLDAHDEPSGSVYWQAKSNTTLTFQLAANVTATASGASEAVLAAGKWHAHIVAHGANVTVSGTTVTVTLTQGDRVAMRAHPPGLGATLHTENRLLAHGRLGAVARVSMEGSDVQALDVNVTAHEVTNDTVELTIASDQHEGRSVILLLDSLNETRPGDVTVELGNESMTSDPDGVPEAGEFSVTQGTEGLALELNVTHFSSYSVTISQSPRAASGTTSGASGAAGASTPLALWVAAGALLVAVALRRRA